ncbi:MAG: sugar phosphate nucleotidyltransferase [Patescibacteria group bacterium]|nr:sugar phosphate nucleotidyltransferase [Patescibacteria group bacterium]
MKERVTITISKDLLDKVDSKIDGTTIKNRSHSIELALSKILRKKELSKGIILAGGDKEIFQDGKKIPVFMSLVNNKPVLEHNVQEFKKQGIKDIIIGVHHKKELIKEHFGDGTSFGVNIAYMENDDPCGTAGVIKNASEFIDGPFVVCNGDVLRKIDIRQFFEFHKKQGTLATIGLTTVNNPENYGVVVLNGNRVHSFVEKPQNNIPSNLINAGIYIFEPEVLEHFPVGFGKLETDVFPKLSKKEEFAGYVFFGKWNYIKNEEQLEIANLDW